jgi:hypothetical protein
LDSSKVVVRPKAKERKVLPRLFADERGVWREDEPGRQSGVEWDEMTAVGGYKLSGITRVFTVVELDHPSGHVF